MTNQSLEHFSQILKKSLENQESTWQTTQQTTIHSELVHRIHHNPEKSNIQDKKNLYWNITTIVLWMIGVFFLLLKAFF